MSRDHEVQDEDQQCYEPPRAEDLDTEHSPKTAGAMVGPGSVIEPG
jgi:hypothetical protein